MKKLRIECPLDQQYADLYEAALRVSASYLERINTAIEMNEGRGLFTHYMIAVRITGPASWRANWVKKNYVKDTESSKKKVKKLRPAKDLQAGQVLGVAIPQGGKFKYAASTFRYMPIEIRNIALRHESMLADLRKLAFENRQLKKSTYYAIARSKEAIRATDDAIKASEIVSEITSSGSAGGDTA